MDYIVRHYTPITADHVVEAIQCQVELPPKAVLVTFDDGYTDFQEHAWPILRERGIPAVLFVPTAFPDSERRFWWDIVHDMIVNTSKRMVMLPTIGTFSFQTPHDRWLTIRRLASDLAQRKAPEIKSILHHLQGQLGMPPVAPPFVMTWEQLRRLAREGLTIASHTRNHPAVATLTSEEIYEELRSAHADLKRELGQVCPLFAFPFGQSAPLALPLLRAQGIVASFTAFTVTPVLNILGQVDPLLLRREAIGGSTSFIEFCLSLTSLYANIQSKPLLRVWRSRVGQWTGPRIL